MTSVESETRLNQKTMQSPERRDEVQEGSDDASHPITKKRSSPSRNSRHHQHQVVSNAMTSQSSGVLCPEQSPKQRNKNTSKDKRVKLYQVESPVKNSNTAAKKRVDDYSDEYGPASVHEHNLQVARQNLTMELTLYSQSQMTSHATANFNYYDDEPV